MSQTDYIASRKYSGFQGFIFVALAAFVTADSHGRPTCPAHQMTVYRKPYLGDCTKYWECFQGASYVVSCPPGLEFNAPMMQCDIPELAKCDHSQSTSPSPDTTSETPTTSPHSWTPDPSCPDAPDVIYYFNYPGDCNKFYECYEGRKYVRQCPAGLYWNEPISRCDYPENVHSCDYVPSTTPTPPTESTPTPTRTTEPTPTTTTSEPTPTPTTSEPTSSPTPPPTEPSTTPTPPTTASPSTTRQPAGKCPYSDRATYYPYPGDCNKFIECYQGAKYIYSCPQTLYWNQNILDCDYREHVDC